MQALIIVDYCRLSRYINRFPASLNV